MDRCPVDSFSHNELTLRRLVIWFEDNAHGIALVSYDQERDRKAFERRLESALKTKNIELELLSLATITEPEAAIHLLRRQITRTDAHAMSVSGLWFLEELGKNWSALNYQREAIFQADVNQVWWIPQSILGEFMRQLPDFVSWTTFQAELRSNFSERESAQAIEIASGPLKRFANADSAKQRSRLLLARFNAGVEQERPVPELLRALRSATQPLLSAGLIVEFLQVVASGLDQLDRFFAMRAEVSDDLLQAKVDLCWDCMSAGDFSVVGRLIPNPGLLRELPPSRVHGMVFGILGDERVAYGRLTEALDFYVQFLKIAEQVLEIVGQDQPQALRDVSVSLNRIGDILSAKGDTEGALARFQRSLEIREQVLEIVGQDQPEALRDVSISLERIGDILRAKGDTEGALARFQRSLEIREQVLEIVGQDQPQALRDVSVSLERIGDILRAKGDIEGALARFQRSLKISEQVLEIVGQDQPQALRDVSVSLNRIGDILSAKGDTEGALARFQRSLEIREQVLEIVGQDQPQAEVDWCEAAAQLAEVRQDPFLAQSAFERIELIVSRHHDQVYFREIRELALTVVERLRPSAL